jgi:two-component system, OmpR family, sensor kinase
MIGFPVRAIRRAADALLWVQLLAVVLLLVVLAMGIVGVTATSALRDYLVDRVDAQLMMTSQDQARHVRDAAPTQVQTGGPPVAPSLQTAFFSEVVDSQGNGTPNLRLPRDVTESGPDLPTLDEAGVDAIGRQPFTVSATDGDTSWRVVVVSLDDGGALVLGTSLSDVDHTVHRLQTVVVVTSTITLVVLGVVGWGLVRRRLHNLVVVEKTARAIAEGDLTHRVPVVGERNEVARLAVAMNVMLDRIESSFELQRESEEEARRSEERMRQFVGDASHELRTPLTSIRGFAELHQRQLANGDEPSPDLVERVGREAMRMSKLVEDLLLLARLDQHRPLEHEPVDLGALAADVVVGAQVTAPDHDVVLVEEGSSTVVCGDELRLRQVISNLVTNACTHTPAGTHVIVMVGVRDDDVMVEVADDGTGMDADDAARVFERFYRSDPSRARVTGGSGLGLAIVAGLVEAQGGRVELETAPGEGSRFVVRFPPLSSVERSGNAKTFQ